MLANLSPMVLSVIAGVLIFSVILVLGWKNAVTQQRQSRLSQVVGVADVPSHKKNSIRKSKNNGNDQVAKRLKDLEKKSGANKEERSIEDRLREAGLPPKKGFFYGLSVFTAILMVLTALLMETSPLSTFFLFIFGALGLPRMVVGFKAGRRRKAVLNDLADALEAVVRSIKAGLPIAEAMGAIAKDFSGPLADEFAIAVDEQKMGLSVGESLERCAFRMPLPEMRMLAMAVSIQIQTGGSLAETLTNMANVIRSREALARKVKAVSSEAKISAMIMGALPLFVMGALWGINPDYVGLLFDDKVGQMMVIGCGGWMSIGVFVMWQMVNFKV